MADQDHIERLIRDAFDTLTDQQRRVFTLHNAHGLDYPSIARILDMSLHEVEKALADALYQLDLSLNPDRAGDIANPDQYPLI